MSVETTNRVWKHSTKGGTALLLLLAMADWSDDWGYCHPSIEQMAVKCRQTERNILNLIAELEKVSEVRRVARGKGGRGNFSGSVYQVTTAMRPEEITTSAQLSPLARSTFTKLQNGEMSLPLPRKGSMETGEKVSPEKPSTDISPAFPCALNELINVSDSTPSTLLAPSKNEFEAEERAEVLYRLVRPTHLTLPNSDQRAVALKVLGIYLKRFESPQAAAEALKPYALEADNRGIRPTNLCWLSEWAAVGQIPKAPKKWQKSSKPESAQEEPIDYESLRKRMEAELTPHMSLEKRNPS